MAGKENNRQRRAFFLEGSLESKTIASHLKIKHQAARHIWIIVFKKFFRRGEGGDGEPMRAQQTRERVRTGPSSSIRNTVGLGEIAIRD